MTVESDLLAGLTPEDLGHPQIPARFTRPSGESHRRTFDHRKPGEIARDAATDELDAAFASCPNRRLRASSASGGRETPRCVRGSRNQQSLQQ
jgi:hypothetical protein